MRSSTETSPPGAHEALEAQVLRRWMSRFADEIDRHENELTELDRAIGDADHGVNMTRGMRAVLRQLEACPGFDWAGGLRIVSAALTSSVGGASGPLYGAFFLSGSRLVKDKARLNLHDLTAFVEAGCQGVMQLGKAVTGDKTMVDTLSATVLSLQASRRRRELLPDAVGACARSARVAATATGPMQARKGRASYLGNRSQGHQDPGATSAQILVQTLEQALGSCLISANHENISL